MSFLSSIQPSLHICPHCTRYFRIDSTHSSQCPYKPEKDPTNSPKVPDNTLLTLEAPNTISPTTKFIPDSPPPLDEFYAETNPQALLSHEDMNYSFDSEFECTKCDRLNDEQCKPLSAHLNSPFKDLTVVQGTVLSPNDIEMEKSSNLVRVISALYSDSFGSDSSSSEDDDDTLNGSNGFVYAEYTPTFEVKILDVAYPKKSPLNIASPSNHTSSCTEAVRTISQHALTVHSGEEVTNELINYCKSRDMPSSYFKSNTDSETARNMKSLPSKINDIFSTDSYFDNYESISNDRFFPVRTPSPQFPPDFVPPQESEEMYFKSEFESHPASSFKDQEQNVLYLRSLFNFLHNDRSHAEHVPSILSHDEVDSQNMTSRNASSGANYPTYEDVTPVVTPQRHKPRPEYHEISPPPSMLNFL